MRALFIQHDHASPAGPIADRFEQRGYSIDYFQVVPADRYESPNVTVTFPDLSQYDVIVPMGASWGVWDDDGIGNWLLPELASLRAAHDRGQAIFGICFGGQLMARALGGSVAPAPSCEIGFIHIHSDDEKLISAGPWFSWHYDRFTVPPGAKEIARTPKAPQAFVLGKTLALQFHPEVTADVLTEWLGVHGATISVLDDGQDPQLLIAQTRTEDEASTKRAYALVDAFLDQIVK